MSVCHALFFRIPPWYSSRPSVYSLQRRTHTYFETYEYKYKYSTDEKYSSTRYVIAEFKGESSIRAKNVPTCTSKGSPEYHGSCTRTPWTRRVGLTQAMPHCVLSQMYQVDSEDVPKSKYANVRVLYYRRSTTTLTRQLVCYFSTATFTSTRYQVLLLELSGERCTT